MNSIEFFNSISEEEKEQLEKSADILKDVFADVLKIGDETSRRLLKAIHSRPVLSDDLDYYSTVLNQCNKIVSLVCSIQDIHISD